MNKLSIFDEIANLDTEKISSQFSNVDILSTEDILKLINSQDMLVANAVKEEIPFIAKAVDIIVDSFKHNGRLIYIGAGTSGRLGILDASECPPTFGTNPDLVQGFIAGGDKAVFRAVEGAEDHPEDGEKLIHKICTTERDTICGIAASGRTPFVLGALQEAKKLKAKTLLITTNSREKIIQKGINEFVDVIMAPCVGPEVVAGSTRMKSGTAQKLILNMLTTTAMIKMGKTYGNIMIDLMPTNNKLKQRTKKILIELAGVTLEEAESILIQTNWNLKHALIMLIANVDLERAEAELNKANGVVKKAIKNILLN